MSLKIRIPRNTAGPSTQTEEPTIRRKPPKRRSTVLDSPDEFEEDDTSLPADPQPTKRARTEERSVGDGEDVDVEVDEEVDVDIAALPIDTRFLPQPPVGSGSKRSSTKKGRPPPRRPKKRVVTSEDEGREEDYEDNQELIVDDDDDFTPEPSVLRRAGASKAKAKTSKATGTETKVATRDARKVTPTAKRGTSADNEDDEDDFRLDNLEAAPRKRKLPPIKKSKPSTSASVSSTITIPKQPPKAPSGNTSSLDGLALPTAGARKPAATANNADFDLRDKSVYASLFMKPGGAQPSSLISRKEKEEERRRELNKMRDDTRAKRAAEAGQKETFDLQAPQEKIARFEQQLRTRVGEAAVMYPNILGGAFRDAMEFGRGLRCRPQLPRRGP